MRPRKPQDSRSQFRLPPSRDTRRAVLHRDGVGLLHLPAFDRHPLEEAIDRHDAAALAICLTEHGQPIDCLRLGVDRRRLRLLLAPVRDEPPLKQIERARAGLGVLPDHPELLARGAVVAWRHVAERIASDSVIPRVESIDDFEPELIGRARLNDASTHVIHVSAELARRKRRGWLPPRASNHDAEFVGIWHGGGGRKPVGLTLLRLETATASGAALAIK